MLLAIWSSPAVILSFRWSVEIVPLFVDNIHLTFHIRPRKNKVCLPSGVSKPDFPVIFQPRDSTSGHFCSSLLNFLPLRTDFWGLSESPCRRSRSFALHTKCHRAAVQPNGGNQWSKPMADPHICWFFLEASPMGVDMPGPKP